MLDALRLSNLRYYRSECGGKRWMRFAYPTYGENQLVGRISSAAAPSDERSEEGPKRRHPTLFFICSLLPANGTNARTDHLLLAVFRGYLLR